MISVFLTKSQKTIFANLRLKKARTRFTPQQKVTFFCLMSPWCPSVRRKVLSVTTLPDVSLALLWLRNCGIYPMGAGIVHRSLFAIEMQLYLRLGIR